MDYQVRGKSRLPASILDAAFMEKLRQVLSGQGDFIWNAIVGTGGDLLGKQTDRPQQIVHEWLDLEQILASGAFDYIQINVEYPETGMLSITFKNFNPAGGLLMAAGLEQNWVDNIMAKVGALFASVKVDSTSKLYGRSGSLILYSLVPLLLAFAIVLVSAALLIPGEIRRSEWVWWITVGTVVATLKVGQLISDRLLRYVLVKYPYLQWKQ